MNQSKQHLKLEMIQTRNYGMMNGDAEIEFRQF